MSLFIRQLYSSLFRARINPTRFSKEVVRLSWPSALNRIGWCRWIVNMSLIPLIRSSRPDVLAINLMNESRCGQTRRRDGVKTGCLENKRAGLQTHQGGGVTCAALKSWRAIRGKLYWLKLSVTQHKGKDSWSMWLKCPWSYKWRHKNIRSAWSDVNTWNKLYRLNYLKLLLNSVKICAKFR